MICKKCRIKKTLQDYHKNKNICKVCRCAETKAWRDSNKEAHNEYTRKYYAENKEKVKKYITNWISENRTKHRNYGKTWRSENPNKVKEYARKRYAKLRAATPVWADMKKISLIYKNCPKDYVVDHIIPLQGQNISGLHVENNLQYLPRDENFVKGNRLNV